MQADIGKVGLNKRNHRDDCQRLSVVNFVDLKHDKFEKHEEFLRSSRFRYGWSLICSAPSQFDVLFLQVMETLRNRTHDYDIISSGQETYTVISDLL